MENQENVSILNVLCQFLLKQLAKAMPAHTSTRDTAMRTPTLSPGSRRADKSTPKIGMEKVKMLTLETLLYLSKADHTVWAMAPVQMRYRNVSTAGRESKAMRPPASLPISVSSSPLKKN